MASILGEELTVCIWYYYKCPGASVISSSDENNVDNFTEQCMMLMAYEIYVGRIWNKS